MLDTVDAEDARHTASLLARMTSVRCHGQYDNGPEPGPGPAVVMPQLCRLCYRRDVTVTAHNFTLQDHACYNIFFGIVTFSQQISGLYLCGLIQENIILNRTISNV